MFSHCKVESREYGLSQTRVKNIFNSQKHMCVVVCYRIQFTVVYAWTTIFVRFILTRLAGFANSKLENLINRALCSLLPLI